MPMAQPAKKQFRIKSLVSSPWFYFFICVTVISLIYAATPPFPQWLMPVVAILAAAGLVIAEQSLAAGRAEKERLVQKLWKYREALYLFATLDVQHCMHLALKTNVSPLQFLYA